MAYFINDTCIGCGVCELKCPVDTISGKAKELYTIYVEGCIDCGVCAIYCPVSCIEDQYGNLVQRIKPREIPKAKVIVDDCTGCEFCVDICPFDCIFMKEDPTHTGAGHFKVAEVVAEDCVACRLCEIVCDKDAIIVPNAPTHRAAMMPHQLEKHWFFAMSKQLPEEKTRPVTLVVQLLVIPLVVVLFCVALGGLFMWLTAERKDFNDYVRALQASSGTQRGQQAQYLLNYIQETKRWQGIFDVTAQISADREQFLARNPQAVTQLVQVFEESAGQDARTRRYVALVLGLLGDKEALPALRRGLSDSDPDTVKNCLWSLARLHDNEAAPLAVGLARSEEPSVRLMAVYALGFLESPQAQPVLLAALNDTDEMVKWNAAFALANRSDRAARDTLIRLLDKEYVDRFTVVTRENRQRYRVAAVTWLARVDGVAAVPVLEKVSREEADLPVRNAAIQQLNDLRKK